MKVIDLLNKIANGEEVPKKIAIGEWEYCEEYENLEYELLTRLADNDFDLNDEVEEDKKIEKLSKFTATDNGQEIEIAPTNFEIAKKVDEIIDHINNGDDE